MGNLVSRSADEPDNGRAPTSTAELPTEHFPWGARQHGPKILGAVPLLGEEELGPHPQHNVARAEAYLRAKFHLDPSNRLVTVHEHYRQTDRQTDRQDRTGQDRQPFDSIG